MEVELKKEYIPLILISLIGIIYVYLALNTAMLGEDEAVYLSISKQFLSGIYPTFSDIGFPNTFPPLFPLIDVIPFLIFGVSLSLSKVIIAVFGVLTLLMVYLICKKFGPMAALSSVAILLSIPLFTQYMFINYMEIPIAFFSALASYLFLKLDSVKKAVVTGSILALSFYAKSSGIFLIIVFFIYSIARYLYKKDVDLKLVLITTLVMFFLLLPWITITHTRKD
jgi:4-amino-4-deoxy-L-arabinose transferase-like glycosyltransferase